MHQLRASAMPFGHSAKLSDSRRARMVSRGKRAGDGGGEVGGNSAPLQSVAMPSGLAPGLPSRPVVLMHRQVIHGL